MGTIASPANLNPLPLDPQALARLAANFGAAPRAAQGVIAAPGPAPIPRNFPGIQPSDAAAGPLRTPGIASPRMAGPAALVPQGAPAQPPPTIASPAIGDSPASLALQQSKDAESAIKPPNYTGKLGVLEKIGDAAGRLFAPGIEQRLGVGTLGYQDRLAAAEGQTDRLEKQGATEAVTAANEAKPEEAQAKIDQANEKLTATQQADADKLAETQKNNTGKLTEAYRKQGLDAEGNPLPDSALTQQELATRQLVQGHVALQTAQAEAQQAHSALQQAQTDALANPHSPAFKLKLQQAQTAAQNAQSKLQGLTYAQIRGIISASEINPAIMDLPQLGLTPDEVQKLEAGLPRNPETGAAVGMHSVLAPTTATRSRGQQAADVIPNFDEAAQQIAQLGPQLGPMAGRWNELLAGRGGFSNPAFAGLRANLDLINGAYARFHLNTEMGYKNFTDLLNAAQSPENLQASLQQMKALAQRYVESGAGSPHAGGAGAGPKVGDTQQHAGATYKFDGTQWVRQ